MRKAVAPFSIELLIAALGTAVAGLEAIVVERTDTALLLAFTSLLLALSVLAVRQEIALQVGDSQSERRLIDGIKEPDWRRDAQREFDAVRSAVTGWANGSRRFPPDSAMAVQIEELQRTRTTVDAVHVGLRRSSIEMLSKQQRGFHAMVDAYKALPESVRCRRILVLDQDDRSVSTYRRGRRIIIDRSVKQIVAAHATPRGEGGLGFELRIHWAKADERRISDVLITDEARIFSIDAFANGEFGELVVCVDPPSVTARVRWFEELWLELPAASDHLAPGRTRRPRVS